MTHIEAERKFVKFVAAQLQLEEDVSIFRGGIPENRPDGVGVLLSGQNDPSEIQAVYQGQILAKFTDRDAALELLDKLDKLFPVYGVQNFPCIIQRGSSEPYSSSERGRQTWFISYNLDVVVC